MSAISPMCDNGHPDHPGQGHTRLKVFALKPMPWSFAMNNWG